MSDPLIRLAGQLGYAHAALSIISTIFLVVFFVVGGFWGPLNDATSVIWALTFVPIVLVLTQLARPTAGQIVTVIAAVGLISALTFAFLQTLLVARVVTFEQSFMPVITMMMIFGLALALLSYLALRAGHFPAGLTWTTVAYGLSFFLGGIGFWLGGWENPLGVAGFVVSALLGPIWGIWLGRVLLAGRLTVAAAA